MQPEFEQAYKTILNNMNIVYDMEALLQRVANTIDFTADDWKYMHENHHDLAWVLMEIEDKYAQKEIK